MNQTSRGNISPYVSTTIDDGVFRVCLTASKVGNHEAAIIAASVHRTLKHEGRYIHSMVLDVSNVQMMQSVGLGMCIDLRNTAHAFGIPTVLSGLGGRLEQLFAMLKIDRLFDLAPRSEPMTAA